MDDEQEPQSELVMPFVSVTSKGGPFDDAAYAAGWEMGKLDAHLSWPGQPRELDVTIREENRAQADLLAMRHGYSAGFEVSGVEGWVFARFVKASVPAPP